MGTPRGAVAWSLSPQGAPQELKPCGHFCFPSTVLACCACADLRPLLPKDIYPAYIDGVGWSDTGARDDGYCPVCNTKNFDAWQKKMAAQLLEKQAQDDALRAEQVAAGAQAEADQARAAAKETCPGTVHRFGYSNGDVYEGQLVGGVRCGQGTMVFADGSRYEGAWAEGVPHGRGAQAWEDGIAYVGDWVGGQMHGHGRYTMCDGYVMDGPFEADEFVGLES